MTPGISRRRGTGTGPSDRRASFIEVWWLAGCHVGPGADVVRWVEDIIQRRVADSRSAASSAATLDAPDAGLFVALWQSAEVELARLLRRRLPLHAR